MSRFIRLEDRQRHIYLSGKTRSGKSTLMHAMIYQDMRAGHGLCLIDAKGDLAPKLLDWVPSYRRDDAIYLDIDEPIPVNFMACRDEKEAMRLVSDIVQVFERMDEGWGIRMDAILRHVVLSLVLAGPCSFLDIHKALTDESVWKDMRENPKIKSNPTLLKFWTTQIEKIAKSESTMGIVFSRMASFVLSPELEKIFGTRNAKLDIMQAMEERKIILVRLNPGDDVSMLYGSLLVSKIQQAIFRRKHVKHPFMLYVDEFQNFKSSGFEQILAMAGGLGLYLTLANQYFGQLDPAVKDAIINNTATYFLFNQEPENADRIKNSLRQPPAPKPVDKAAIRNRIALLEKREAAMTEKINSATSLGEDDSYARKISDDSYDERMRLERQLKDGPPSPDEIANLKEAIRFWREVERNNEYVSGSSEARTRAEAFERELQEVTRPKERVSFVDMLPHLPVGTCIYRAADGTTTRIKTPAPPSKKHNGNAAYIKARTLAQYSPNRTMLSPTGLSPQVSQDKGDDKEDEIAPSGPANITVE